MRLFIDVINNIINRFHPQPIPAPSPVPVPVPVPNPSPAPVPASDVAKQLLVAHNQKRQQNGLTQLLWSDKLGQAALAHCQDEASTGRAESHTGSDGSSPFDRMNRAGYQFSLAGENIAQGYPDVASVMNGWMNSPGHRANILRSGFVDFGAAEVNGYWTVDFGTPLAGAAKAFLPYNEESEFFPGLLRSPQNDK